MHNEKSLRAMIGQTVTSVEGLVYGSETVTMRTAEGNELRLQYDYDCCASCSVEQIDGDPEDLVGVPLLMCEIVDSEDVAPACEDPESYTWTFVKFGTVKGYVTVRWFGRSNGYYSESPTCYYNGKY